MSFRKVGLTFNNQRLNNQEFLYFRQSLGGILYRLQKKNWKASRINVYIHGKPNYFQF
jgi:hypothetical protein